MQSKEEANEKIAAAKKSCATVHAAWHDATTALNTNVSVNGFGIYRDPGAVRSLLRTAQTHIAAALQAMDQTTFPANADYEQL